MTDSDEMDDISCDDTPDRTFGAESGTSMTNCRQYVNIVGPESEKGKQRSHKEPEANRGSTKRL